MVKINCILFGVGILASLLENASSNAECNYYPCKLANQAIDGTKNLINKTISGTERIARLTVTPFVNFGESIKQKITRTFTKVQTSGVPAVSENYPFLVEVINDQKDNNLLCGGVIINHNYILTSALCFNEVDLSKSNIYIRTIVPNNWFKAHKRQTVKVETIHLHPCYNPLSNDKQNDLAILELEKSLHFNKFVDQIELPDREYNSTASGEVLGLGIGLLKANVKYILLEECAQYFHITTHQICVGQGQGSCVQKAAGLPFLQHNENGDVTLAGIGSYTSEDCTSAPTVYTRISKYVYWITSLLEGIKPVVIC